MPPFASGREDDSVVLSAVGMEGVVIVVEARSCTEASRAASFSCMASTSQSMRRLEVDSVSERS